MFFKINNQSSSVLERRPSQSKPKISLPISVTRRRTIQNQRAAEDQGQVISQNQNQKQSILSENPSEPSSHLDIKNIMLDEDFLIVGNTSLSLEQKKRNLNKLFINAAIENDVEKLQSLWDKWNPAGWLDINFKDEDSLTPLIHASFCGNYSAVKFILDSGAKVNLANNSGWTALMWAANNNFDGIVKLLLENGASLDARSTKGYTAISIASINISSESNYPAQHGSGPEDCHSPKLSIEASCNISNYNTLNSIKGFSGNESGLLTVGPKKKINRHSKVLELLQGGHTKDGTDGFSNLLNSKNASPSGQSPNSNSSKSSHDSIQSFKEKPEESLYGFDWETVLPNQMYVVPLNGLGKFLRDLVSNTELCLSSQEIKETNFDFASMLFFAIRFISTLEDSSLLDEFLQQIAATFISVVSKSKDKIEFLAYYYSNAQILHYFLLREPNLNPKTDSIRERLLLMLGDIYTRFNQALRTAVDEYLDESLLDYCKDPTLFENITFEKEQRQSSIFQIFRAKNPDTQNQSAVGVSGKPLQRSMSTRGPRPRTSKLSTEVPSNKSSFNVDLQKKNRRSVFFGKVNNPVDMVGLSRTNSDPKISIEQPIPRRTKNFNSTPIKTSLDQNTQLTPNSIIQTVESFAKILSKHHIYPELVSSFVQQSLFYLSAEMFNRVLTTKEFCCRSRALQIRMNLTILEDWLSRTSILKFSPNRLKIFAPLVELLQILQVLTSLSDLGSFVETIQGFNYLNILHLDTIIKNYRYEVAEKKVSPQIICYVQPSAARIKELQNDQRKIATARSTSFFDFGDVKDKLSYYDSLNNDSSFDMSNKNSFSDHRGVSFQGYNNSTDIPFHNRAHDHNGPFNVNSLGRSYFSNNPGQNPSELGSNYHSYDRYESASTSIKSRVQHQTSLYEILSSDNQRKIDKINQVDNRARSSSHDSASANSSLGATESEVGNEHGSGTKSSYNDNLNKSSNFFLSSFLDNLSADNSDGVLNLKNSYDLFDSSNIVIPKLPTIEDQLRYWSDIRTRPNLPVSVCVKATVPSSPETSSGLLGLKINTQTDFSKSVESDGLSTIVTETSKSPEFNQDHTTSPTIADTSQGIFSAVDLIPLLPNIILSEL